MMFNMLHTAIDIFFLNFWSFTKLFVKREPKQKEAKKTWIYKTLKNSVKICCHELVNVDLMDFRPLLVEMLFITFSSFIFYIQMKITSKLRYKFIFPCTICTLKEKEILCNVLLMCENHSLYIKSFS